MKIKCRYSGTTILSSKFGGWLLPDSAHHLMLLSHGELLSHAEKIKDGSLDAQEETLYFVALLKATQLVTFYLPAQPEYKVVATNIVGLIKLLVFMNKLGYDDPALYGMPSFAVTTETADLSSLHIWLAECHQLRAEWTSSSARDSLRRSMLDVENAYDKLIRSPFASLESLTHIKVMMRWAFAASSTPPQHREIWTKIAAADRKELQFIPAEHIDDMIEFMECNLAAEIYSNTGTRFHFFMTHLRRQKSLREIGAAWGSLVDIESSASINSFTATGGVSRVKTFFFAPASTAETENANALAAPTFSNSQDVNIILSHLLSPEQLANLDDLDKQRINAIKYGPRQKPDRNDFSNTIEYLRVLAPFRARQDALKAFGLEGVNFDE